MKKLISMLLAVIMVMSLFAACGNTEDKKAEPTTEATAEPTTDATSGATAEDSTEESTGEATEEVVVPADSNESTVILENIWAQMGEDQFFIMGGNIENYVDGAPGNYNMEYKENLPYNLLVPEAELANIDEAGFMQHSMNANNFTAGVVHYTGDVAAFAAAMQSAIQNNQWMCGFPETLLIAEIDSQYILVSFGINDAMNPFISAVSAAYADAQILYNEAIAG